MNHDLVISYEHSDVEIAYAVCSALEGVGVKCWIAPWNTPSGSSLPPRQSPRPSIAADFSWLSCRSTAISRTMS